MSEQGTHSNEEHQDENRKQPKSIKRILLVSLCFCLLFLILYVIADRVTPFSNQASVKGFVIPIVPEVSGTVAAIPVEQNSLVKAGDILVSIDPERYELAVANAEIDLERAGKDIGTDTASVATAQAALLDARAQKENADKQMLRINQLYKKDVVSQAEYDTAEMVMAQTEAALKKAEAELRKAQNQLGAQGKENINVRAALNALEQAKVDLHDTVIHAPTNGGITNLQISVGHYARVGEPLMTFISTDAVWIEAHFRENNLGRMKPGDMAEITLDIAPGRVFNCEVISIGYGVSKNANNSLGQLPDIKPTGGWLRDPQLFPVLLKFSDKKAFGLRRVGGQASVIVYTGDSFFMNAIGKVRIYLTSLLSYLY